MARHEILGGKVQLYRRGEIWHCAASVDGQQFRKSTNIGGCQDRRSADSRIAVGRVSGIQLVAAFDPSDPLTALDGVVDMES
jgi:hypothetical protein